MTTFSTSREIPATVEQVFAAFSDPERLSRWWGPAGFTNTFSVCEFKKGGRWSFVMHGPDGRKYLNESVFAEIEPPGKIVIQHVSGPKYCLTIGLASSAGGTVVSWAQEFENSKVAGDIEHIVVPANEQNLDRLSAEVLGGSALFAGEHGGKEHGGKSEAAGSGTPSGWTQGKKTGWAGAGRPPGQVKKMSKSRKRKTK